MMWSRTQPTINEICTYYRNDLQIYLTMYTDLLFVVNFLARWCLTESMLLTFTLLPLHFIFVLHCFCISSSQSNIATFSNVYTIFDHNFMFYSFFTKNLRSLLFIFFYFIYYITSVDAYLKWNVWDLTFKAHLYTYRGIWFDGMNSNLKFQMIVHSSWNIYTIRII